MKKISWIRRIFMSWSALEKYFKNTKNFEDASQEQVMFANKQAISANELLIKTLQDNLDIEKGKNATINQDLQKIKFDADSKQTQLFEKNEAISQLREQIDSQKVVINEKINTNSNLKTEISEKLSTLNRIEKTFFAATGNKGKGELGEMQLKSILEKSGLTSEMWTENLPVGSSNVEFAIKSGRKEDEWIPIDSKVLETEIDEDDKAIIDDKYKKRVLAQAREVKKYLGKKNTAKYGLLVLQSDSIYMKLYEEFPIFFQETMRDQKIFITSPSSFVQFAGTISQILDIYEKINNDEQIYIGIRDVFTSVSKFVNKIDTVHKDFNIAFDTHYPTIQKRYISLENKLEKNGKTKNKVPSLNFKVKNED